MSREDRAQGRVTLWAIEVFAAMADERATAATARRLGISASAVSQQISALEAALGAELFDRSARPLQLTAAGRIFLRHADAVLDELARARAGVGLADPAGLTTFRLGMIEDFEVEVTPRLLAGMAGDLTRCRFLLETAPSHRLHAQLDDRTLDMIVAAAGETRAEGVDLHPLLHEPFVAVYPVGGDANLPLIQYSQRTLMGRQIAAHLAREGLRPDPRFEMDSYRAILALVAAGQGWTILTPSGLLHAPPEGLEVRPVPFAPLARRIALYVRTGTMGDLPGQVAGRLRDLLARRVVEPAVASVPWLAGELRVEG